MSTPSSSPGPDLLPHLPVALDPPRDWQRLGLILARRASGVGSQVVGDPAIVWDAELPGWRMFLFMEPPGHGEAVCRVADPGILPQADDWSEPVPLEFTNPGALLGGTTHKPVVVVERSHPNRAACIAGRYALLTISHAGRHKVVQRAWAERLAGPWTLEAAPLIANGAPGDFDGRHADAVNGMFFPERDEVLYTYMGYPEKAQPWPTSPFGNAQGMAVGSGTGPAVKLGPVLPPCAVPGHWASGWVGGMQIMPGRSTRWIALLNASPTPPRRGDPAISAEEPAPSLGGFAVCDEDWPVRGWRWCPAPLLAIGQVESAALAAGEGVNFWRHHLLATPDAIAVLYNSGAYGCEQLYGRRAALAP